MRKFQFLDLDIEVSEMFFEETIVFYLISIMCLSEESQKFTQIVQKYNALMQWDCPPSFFGSAELLPQLKNPKPPRVILPLEGIRPSGIKQLQRRSTSSMDVGFSGSKSIPKHL